MQFGTGAAITGRRLSMGLGLTLAASVAVVAGTLGAGTAKLAGAQHGLESLALSARGPISSALGDLLGGYRVHGLHAINSGQRLSVRFIPGGASLASGTGTLAVSLSAVGHGATLTAVAPAAPHATANRVIYTHGAVREWYTNGPLGLEQGFDLAQPPAGGA